MSSVKDFQSFMINDSQLKSTGKILNQANLFALNGDKSGQGKPNRLALVLVSDSEKNRIYIIDSVKYKKCIIRRSLESQNSDSIQNYNQTGKIIVWILARK